MALGCASGSKSGKKTLWPEARCPLSGVSDIEISPCVKTSVPRQERGSVDFRQEHVRASAWVVEGRVMERVVGHESSVPHTCLCAHTLRACSTPDGRRNHLLLRY